jgi:hypothetical protein
MPVNLSLTASRLNIRPMISLKVGQCLIAGRKQTQGEGHSVSCVAALASIRKQRRLRVSTLDSVSWIATLPGSPDGPMDESRKTYR